MTSSNECLKSLPVCGGCETPPCAWGVSQLGYDDRPKNRLKRCVVHAMCAQSSQRIQSLRVLCDWQMIVESYSKYFDNWDTGYVWHRLWQLHCCFAPVVHEDDLGVLGAVDSKVVDPRQWFDVNQFRLPTVGVDSWDDDVSVINKLQHLATRRRDWFQVFGVDYVWWWSYTGTLDNTGCNFRHRI